MVAEIAARKLFIGPRLKRLRRDLALTQTRMAEDLAVSPSYLNLLERNQRPVTAQILLRLAEAYDVDLRSLGADGDEQATIELAEILSRSEEHTSELQSRQYLVCRLLLEKKNDSKEMQ